MKIKGIVLLLILIVVGLNIYAQTATIKGNVYDSDSKPMHYANVSVVGYQIGTTTDKKGYFELSVPASVEIRIEISYLSHETYTALFEFAPGECLLQM
jgi:hypothetical protein